MGILNIENSSKTHTWVELANSSLNICNTKPISKFSCISHKYSIYAYLYTQDFPLQMTRGIRLSQIVGKPLEISTPNEKHCKGL